MPCELGFGLVLVGVIEAEGGELRVADPGVVIQNGFSPCELVFGLVFVGFAEVEGGELRVSALVVVSGTGSLLCWMSFVGVEDPEFFAAGRLIGGGACSLRGGDGCLGIHRRAC